MSELFSELDRAQLSERGIAIEEAERQLALLRDKPRFKHVVRPATLGDGIDTIAEADHPDLVARHEAAAREGRFLKFIPASGAATRMFQDVIAEARGGRGLTRAGLETRARAGVAAARQTLAVVDALPRLPFRAALEEVLARRGHDSARLSGIAVGEILDALLSPDGLGYAETPKGRVPFHAGPDLPRTAFEEHLVEGAAYVKDGEGRSRFHFTVSEEHLGAYEDLARRSTAVWGPRLGTTFEIGFSTQKGSTDTLCVESGVDIGRDDGGRILLRPGGHGALLENLAELNADLVFIKNIDNVQPDATKPATVLWKKLLAGHLLSIQQRIQRDLEAIRNGLAGPRLTDQSLRFLSERLHVHVPEALFEANLEAQQTFLVERLDRPLRVCGVVRNSGEPGGGPFWVQGPDGEATLQIVESAEVRVDWEPQRAMLSAATHFNPVDLVCAMRDPSGRRYDPRGFADKDAVILARKNVAGRDLTILERPGLWNGGMARWITLFVEVPAATFTPVKNVLDLLRPEHQV